MLVHQRVLNIFFIWQPETQTRCDQENWCWSNLVSQVICYRDSVVKQLKPFTSKLSRSWRNTGGSISSTCYPKVISTAQSWAQTYSKTTKATNSCHFLSHGTHGVCQQQISVSNSKFSSRDLEGAKGPPWSLMGFPAGLEPSISISTLWLCQNSYWKWPFIVDFPIKNGGSFHCYVSSPEGISKNNVLWDVKVSAYVERR